MSPQYFNKERKQYGIVAAMERLGRRRHMPLVGYLILAAAIGYQFVVERNHSNLNRSQLAENGRAVLYTTCVRGNELRATLQRILEDEKPSISAQLKIGKLTKVEADHDRHFLKIEEARLAPINCLDASKRLK